jgi:hypothetical protein
MRAAEDGLQRTATSAYWLEKAEAEMRELG